MTSDGTCKSGQHSALFPLMLKRLKTIADKNGAIDSQCEQGLNIVQAEQFSTRFPLCRNDIELKVMKDVDTRLSV